jgi:glucose/arabinose dehydrogenase
MSGRRIERIAINQGPLQRERREALLTPLGLRVRDVQQGPDGYLYVAAEQTSTARPDGLLLRIEPVP